MFRPVLERRPAAQKFRQLNARHRHALLVAALSDPLGIETEPGKTDESDRLYDELRFRHGAATLGTLRLYRSARTADDKKDDAQTTDAWKAQCDALLARKRVRGPRLEEIVMQQTDIISYLQLPLRFGPATHPWTSTLLAAVLAATQRVEYAVKSFFDFARPVEMHPDIQPIIQTPAHSSFPSGHATEAFCLQYVMSGLFLGHTSKSMQDIAARIAENRSYAGVHFAADNHAGATLGHAIGGAILNSLTGAPAQSAGISAGGQSAGIVDATDFAAGLAQGALTPVAGHVPAEECLAWIMSEVHSEIR
ncbi:MAG: phosphatase PAP2 family protein [Brevirhabdus sp.]